MYFDWQTNVLNTSILFYQYIIIQIVIQKLFIFCKRECHRMFIKHKLLQIVGCLTGYKVEVVASLAKKDLTPDMTR